MDSQVCARTGSALSCAVLAVLLGGCFSPQSGGDGDEAATGTGTTGGDTGPDDGEASGSDGEGATGSDDDDDDGDGDTGGDEADDEAPDDAGQLEAACEEYCGLIDDHCTDADAQYTGPSTCRSVCAAMDLGDPGDALGNSVECRTFHSVLAAESAVPHCAHAGPTGDGTCGATCESFCSLSLVICNGEQQQWPDADTCIAECQGWNPEPQYTADAPDADTYACRVRHLTLAALQPDIHCSHIGDVSPVCTDG